MLFQFRNNYINYGVIANENDNKDSIKAWIKRGQANELTELQIQLRSVEEQMAVLQTEIEKMKPKPESEKKLIYNKVTKLAQKYPVENKRYFNISEAVAKAYVSCLAHIIVADEDKIYEKLLYLTRIAYGIGLDAPADDIIRMGMDFDKTDFDNACVELKEVKYTFLTDALILVNISEQASEDVFALIADTAQALGCNKEDIRAAGFVAKAVLKNDFDILNQMPAPSHNPWAAQLRKYIPDSWIESKRIKCGSFRDKFKDKILEGTKKAEFAIIVISQNFFDREWTEKELVAF